MISLILQAFRCFNDVDAEAVPFLKCRIAELVPFFIANVFIILQIPQRQKSFLFLSDGEVTCLNRKPGLRLESGGVEDAELLAYLVREEKDIYIGVVVLVCHLTSWAQPS
jgi:hypothetical protein